ncbi:MAG TPA: Calx-beta domain-containing protein [Thermoanaerobaculia bacterium]|nr:Calx-beta domain-containing protein [Thermoanaerobaculia bacterium]
MKSSTTARLGDASWRSTVEPRGAVRHALLVLASAAAFVPALAAQVPSTERAALEALYQATGGQAWIDDAGWLGAPGTECSWFGVACEEDNVVALRLIENGLVGTIPAEIGDLSRLRNLNLIGNRLGGEIPDDFWDLIQLEVVVLSFNELSGSLSPAIGRLTALRAFYASVNRLSGPIPEEIGDLTNLRFLYLSANDLSGTIPPAIGGLIQLEELTFSYNRLDGEIPIEIGGLTDLRVLGLGANELFGPVPPALTNLSSLEVVNLFWNRLTVDDPEVEGFLGGLLEEDLELTQTVPPEVVVDPIDTETILVRWFPIAYTADDGGYRVFLRPSPGAPFELAAEVPGKTSFAAFLDGLDSKTTYDISVRSYTLPHERNADEVESLPSPVFSSATAPEEAPGYFELASRRRFAEGETRFFNIRRFGGSFGRVTVDYDLVSGTATEGLDFVGVPGTLVFEDGEKLAKLVPDPLELLDDDLVEPDETFAVVLGNPTGGATINEARSRLEITIGENDLTERTDISSTGSESRIASDASGRRVVVWTDADDDGSGVYGQLYDPEGRPEGRRFRANGAVEGDQSRPDAAFDPTTGGFVVAWQSATSDGTSIVSRRFSPEGLPEGDEQPVDEQAGDASSPAVAISPDGGVRIAWERRVPPGEPATNGRQDADVFVATAAGAAATSIVSRGFSPSGSPVGASVEVSEGTAAASSPDISVNEEGEIAITWQETDAEGEAEVVARILDPTAAPRGQVFAVPADPAGSQSNPTVAALAGGDFLVAFQARSGDDPSSDVFAQRIGREGDREGSSFLVNQMVAGSQEKPRIAINEKGECFVGWQNAGGGGPVGIVGRNLPGCLEPAGEDMTIAETGDESLLEPTFSLDEGGRLTSVFALDDRDASDGGIQARVVPIAIVGGDCVVSKTTLCLQDERFRVTTEWTDFENATSSGQARALTTDTGFFWFFDEDNIEIVVKVLDACAFANRYWVFAGGLTNVGVELRVTDTDTGVTQSYSNPLGSAFTPILDVDAFACP